MGIISDHRELWVFGKSTTEVWYNSGNASFPFERAQGGFIERGCRAPGSIAKTENSVIWLGDDLAVYAAPGYQAQRISTPQIEKMIASASDAASAWGYVYRQEGHNFYALTFSDLTLCYDFTTGSWHRRRSRGIDRWRVSALSQIGDRHIAGDYATGDLYELSLDTYDDGGDEIEREIVTSHITATGGRISLAEVFVDFEPGVGTGSGQGEDPQAALDWSDDGGATWSNELWRAIGPAGDRAYRATWARLGAFRRRALRIRISDPVKVAIAGIYIRAEGMES
jgi:hypothetical protein